MEVFTSVNGFLAVIYNEPLYSYFVQHGSYHPLIEVIVLGHKYLSSVRCGILTSTRHLDVSKIVRCLSVWDLQK